MPNSLLTDLYSDLYLESYLEITRTYGTPSYVYLEEKIINNYLEYQNSFKNINHLICYAVKANSNLSILNTLAKLGAGFDIVSLGELKRVIAAGGDATKVVFSGVGKQDFEIKEALENNICCFNVESEPELYLINQVAKQLNKQASVSIRVNPNVDAKSHPYISTGLSEHKFGIDINYAQEIYNHAKELDNIKVIGVDCHIGSQLTETNPIEQACQSLNSLLANLSKNNINITHINLGGGLGINYDHTSQVPSKTSWINTILNTLEVNKNYLNKTKIIIEPGRSIVGDAGLLLTKVIYNKIDKHHKKHNFSIIDAAMNDLLRPALYHAEHKIINLTNLNTTTTKNITTSIVGPVCESSDVFAKNIEFNCKPEDILAILDSGAYGFTMASNYNSRPRPSEILIEKNGNIKLIRPRETYQELYNTEII